MSTKFIILDGVPLVANVDDLRRALEAAGEPPARLQPDDGETPIDIPRGSPQASDGTWGVHVWTGSTWSEIGKLSAWIPVTGISAELLTLDDPAQLWNGSALRNFKIAGHAASQTWKTAREALVLASTDTVAGNPRWGTLIAKTASIAHASVAETHQDIDVNNTWSMYDVFHGASENNRTRVGMLYRRFSADKRSFVDVWLMVSTYTPLSGSSSGMAVFADAAAYVAPETRKNHADFSGATSWTVHRYAYRLVPYVQD